jgi:hypothetical protein
MKKMEIALKTRSTETKSKFRFDVAISFEGSKFKRERTSSQAKSERYRKFQKRERAKSLTPGAKGDRLKRRDWNRFKGDGLKRGLR